MATIILLHFNGANASTVFTDDSGKVWTAAGDAKLTTSEKKFGSAALALDGAGDYITTPASADIARGTGDFTIDCWVRFNELDIAKYYTVAYQSQAGVSEIEFGYFYYSSGSWQLECYFKDQVSDPQTTKTLKGAVSLAIDTWYHVALCRSGTNLYMFLDGALSDSDVWAGTLDYNNTSFYIGAYGGPYDYFNGEIDEFRFTDEAMWTAPFTPPTSEYIMDHDIDAGIVVSPVLSGEIMRGLPGDIWDSHLVVEPVLAASIENVPPKLIDATIVVAPTFSATARAPIVINAGIAVSPILVSGIEYKNIINSSISISPQMSSTMTFGWEATFNTSFPALTLDATGYDSCIGELIKDFPSLTLTATGEPSLDGALAVSLPSLTLAATGVCDGGGEFSKSLPALTISSTAIISEHGSANLTLRGLYLEGEALAGVLGELTQNLPGLTLSAEAFQNETGEANLTLPMMRLYAYTTPSAYDAMVLNLKNKALTSFSNYVFNSMCRFNGVHLGASATGIFDLDTGDTDNGTLVEWNFRTGYLDMIDTTVKPNVKKRLKQAWLSYKSNGDVMVTVLQPDGTSYEYDLTGVEVYDTGLRVKFGKGFRSRYLALDVSDIDGCTIELDTMKLQYDKVDKER